MILIKSPKEQFSSFGLFSYFLKYIKIIQSADRKSRSLLQTDYVERSIQKTLNNSIFCFLFRKTKAHQFQELFTGNFSNRRLMDKACGRTDSVDFRCRNDPG